MTLNVYALQTGSINMPLDALLAGEEGRITVPVPCYLIEHPKGSLLFDSGMHVEMQTDPRSRIGKLTDEFNIEFKQGEEVAAQLALLNVDAEKIDILVNSHLHYDHAGGNEAIPNARLIVQKREWDAGREPDLIASNGYQQHDYNHGHDLELIDGEHDLFGDGSVVCIPTYGHTPGHQSLKLTLGSGRIVCLCGDACYLRRNLDEMRLPSVVHDKVQMRESLERLSGLRKLGAQIFYGHDPEFWATLPAWPRRIA
ncbi:N-acyl homoserine lactonase family protein [Caballeronia novacaledonica]|uniref:N-acyl homoserine lactonase family protein n=1 Tax=Caballeronia novacaledonica TaxID=1544861 RepID=A0ACB5R5K7_9BURK|nr:N-acyl homoserine lactonase family protein [Caballeronia sp. LZ029]MDR5748866.1 N-acyl homoserine lactonase family protein [Caballeronia sp. LZ029]GJH22558.1 N-acyl homoserine lactonase family protein [Caballeronia novacaledonica]